MNDLNETPTDISITASDVDENQPAGTVIGTFTTTDEDPGDVHSYSLVAGTGDTDNANFQIVGDELRTNAVFDYETQGPLSIRVRTTDNGTGSLTFDKVFTITINDINDAPTDIYLSNDHIDEGLPGGVFIGTLATTDQDPSDNHSYELVSGPGDTDNASFRIVGIVLRTDAGTVLDYDVKDTYTIRVRTTDNGTGNLTFEKILLIHITDQNFDPTDISLSNSSIDENQPSGTVVGTLTTTDPDAGDNHTYTLVAGTGDTDNIRFIISGNQLQSNAVFDYETQNSFSVRIRTTDDGDGNLTYDEVFTISVNDLNDAPTDVSLSNNSVDEGLPAGTTVGTLLTSDQDVSDNHTYTLVSGTGDVDNASFRIVGNELQTNALFNYNIQDTYTIRIQTTDDGTGNLTFEKVFIILVNRVNSAPTGILLTQNNVNENEPAGTVVGTLSSIDADAGNTHSYSILPGGDASSFDIAGNSLITATVFNYEVRSSYSFTIRTTDNFSGTYDSVFVITVNDINEAPQFVDAANNPVDVLTFSLEADDPLTICPIVVDEDGDITSYAFIGSITGHGLLEADPGNSDCVIFTPDTSFRGTDTARLVATDNRTPALTDTLTFIFTITEPYVNHPPVITDETNNPADTLYYYTFINEPAEICINASDPDADEVSITSILVNEGDVEIQGQSPGTLCFDAVPATDFMGYATITLTIQDDGSPVLYNSAVIVLIVEPKFEFSQAISPNGDGINDFLTITGIDRFPDNTLTIFNRWGDIVYLKKGYDNLNNVWEGRTETTGDFVPEGTYFYILEIKGYKKLVKGFVVLKR